MTCNTPTMLHATHAVRACHAVHAVQIGAMFEEEQATSRHVQFSSRRSPAEILAGLEAAAEELGGSVQRLGDKRCVAGCVCRLWCAAWHAATDTLSLCLPTPQLATDPPSRPPASRACRCC